MELKKYYNKLASEIFSLGYAIGSHDEKAMKRATIRYLRLEKELEDLIDTVPFRQTVEQGLFLRHVNPTRYILSLERETNQGEN